MLSDETTAHSLETLIDAAAARQLAVLGGFHPGAEESLLPPGTATLLLLGPGEPGFWPHVTAAAEFNDGHADPLDRWSRRVIGGWAREIGAQALFPFTGPPYLPFIAWAKRSGRIWQSPVSLLLHAEAGLFLSIRGALALPDRIALPAPEASPCAACPDRPCLTACPAAALTGAGYDVAACHAYLDRPSGAACLEGGCAVRLACPVSRRYPRLAAQSAFHMAAFHTADVHGKR